MLSLEAKYKLLKTLVSNPEASQRELSKALGMSLGRVNHCINALLQQGLIEATVFKNKNNKQAHQYHLSRKGKRDHPAIGRAYLTEVEQSAKALKQEITQLKRDLRRLEKPS